MDEEIKEEEIALFNNMVTKKITDISESFAEDYEFWSEKMKNVNTLMEGMNKSESDLFTLYTYNEFCKAILESVQNIIDDKVDFNRLFLTKKEFDVLRKGLAFPEDEIKFKLIIINNLKDKYKQNFVGVIDDNLTYTLVRRNLNNDSIKEFDIEQLKDKDYEKFDTEQKSKK